MPRRASQPEEFHARRSALEAAHDRGDEETFVRDFADAWEKVMKLDRFELG